MRVAGALLALVLLASSCSDASEPDEPESAPSSSPPGATTSESPPAAEPTPELPPVHHPVSLPALMREDFRAGRLRTLQVLGEDPAYTRSQVTYESNGVTVSGVLLRPRGPGPFPGIVLNHGYIEPSIYVTGQGLAREQDWLARAGFVVLHTDYRGHAASDPVAPLEREARLGYTRDAINAVLALEREPYVDPDRMAMLGRSMGGGITLNALVAYPDLVEAAVVYASVSSRYLDNLRHFTERSRPEAVRALYDRFGPPGEQPRFYRELSSRTFFDRITDPVLMHHGTADETCPFPWATTTQRLLQRAGVDSRLEVYRGETHAFYPQWQDSIETTVRFLRRRLGV
jgi:dipeptidyl aminopeptidase/acylaminoacyl peptidase